MAPGATHSGCKTKPPLCPDEAVVPITDPTHQDPSVPAIPKRDGHTRVVKKKKQKYSDGDSDVGIQHIPGSQASQSGKNGSNDRAALGNHEQEESSNQQASASKALPSNPNSPVFPMCGIQEGIGGGTPSRQLVIRGRPQDNLEMRIHLDNEGRGGKEHLLPHPLLLHGSTRVTQTTQRMAQENGNTEQVLGTHGATSLYEDCDGDTDIAMVAPSALSDDHISACDSSASEMTDVDDRLYSIFKPKIANFVWFQSLLDSAVQVSGPFKPTETEQHPKIGKWTVQDIGSSSTGMPIKTSQKHIMQMDAEP